MTISYKNIIDAANVLKNIAHRTPVLTSRFADQKANARVFFKCENFQRVGAFKFRGAYYAISRLTDDQKRKGVVAFSSGNHAQGVALASRLLNVPATIVMPSDAPSIKLAATKEYGATVVSYDKTKEDREAVAETFVRQKGLTLIPPFDHPDIIAGQGTAAKEFFEEVGELDYLFVPIGGGGLISGCAIAAAHLSPNCKIIGVEPDTGNDAQQSFVKKEIVKIPIPDTIADGARTQSLGKLTFPIVLLHVSNIVTVSDDALIEQMHFFTERMKIVAEPTGCLAAAAVLNNKVNLSGARVGVIVSGGNLNAVAFKNTKKSMGLL